MQTGTLTEGFGFNLVRCGRLCITAFTGIGGKRFFAALLRRKPPHSLNVRCAEAAAVFSWRVVSRLPASPAQNDGYRAPPFSVILNGGCRSEESLITSARLV